MKIDFSKYAILEEELKQGDVVYTPDKIFGSEKKHNLIMYDPRIVYSLHFGHEPIWYKIEKQ